VVFCKRVMCAKTDMCIDMKNLWVLVLVAVNLMGVVSGIGDGGCEAMQRLLHSCDPDGYFHCDTMSAAIVG